MNAFTTKLSREQERIIRLKVADEIHKQMESFLSQYDAMWLWALAREYGWGKARLERAYKAFYRLREEDKLFFETNGYENLLESEAVRNLSRMGLNITDLQREYGEPVVQTVLMQ